MKNKTENRKESIIEKNIVVRSGEESSIEGSKGKQPQGSTNELKAGKAAEGVLKRSVLNQIRTRRDEVLSGAGIGHDCACLYFPEAAVTCMQEAVVITEESAQEEILHHRFTMADLIQKCANNLAAGGAVPVAVELALLLPTGTEEGKLRKLMAEAEEKCKELSMQIIGGQTSAGDFVSAPVAVVTGYGKSLYEKGHGLGMALPGQDIVVSKWIGLQGTALLARWNREKLLGRYPAYLVNEAMGFGRYLSVLPEAKAAVEFGVSAMHDASEGGILAALWEMAEGTGVGLTVDMRRLPLRQETVEVCEFCNTNPYQLLSGGCLVMTTADGVGLAQVLETKDIPAQVVGRITDSNDRILLNKGETRYLDRPR